MTTLLFETSPTDVVTFGALTGGVILIALIASAAPALRAARVDPLEALRYE